MDYPKVMKYSTLFLFVMMLLTSCSNQQHPFALLDNKIAGVDFVNTLKYSEDMNAYLFRSFYNGAGVGLADLNNDGHTDLFFVAIRYKINYTSAMANFILQI